jgi:hypothetical protein
MRRVAQILPALAAVMVAIALASSEELALIQGWVTQRERRLRPVSHDPLDPGCVSCHESEPVACYRARVRQWYPATDAYLIQHRADEAVHHEISSFSGT